MDISSMDTVVDGPRPLVGHLDVWAPSTRLSIPLMLWDGQTLTVGRDHSCVDFAVPETTVSRKHFELTASNGTLFVDDLNSANGTTVSGVPVTERRALRDGDSIEFGRARAVLRLGDTAGRHLPASPEDADVDELLSLIASAQDRLASDYSATRTILITDMASFSEMTETEGSMSSALMIQKHRDLLLPVIARHRGIGKSTGGDGLMAAFAEPSDAVLCAVDMQRTLAAHNVSHPGSRSMSIRMGIASGEIMLDRIGRPFIGAALNLAARVMSLADGGQIIATADTASTVPPEVHTHDLGAFSLKGIAAPTQVHEVLWAENQVPGSVHSSADADTLTIPPAEGETGAIVMPEPAGDTPGNAGS